MRYEQGLHDGLCGFYSTLNAIKALDPTPSKRRDLYEGDQTFFDAAVLDLAQLEDISLEILRGDAKEGGIGEGQIADLAKRIGRRFGLKLKVSTLSDLEFSGTFRQLVQYV